MASTMIHYAISKRICKEIDVGDQERFLFGATIVPDASSHEDGSYNQAHFVGWSDDCLKKGMNWSVFEQRYCDEFDKDSIYLGYWCHLIQDAIWFHDILDKYVRIHPREIRKAYLQKGYDDYVRLNYLLTREYQLESPSFSRLDVPMKEVREDMILTKLDVFYKQFRPGVCMKSDLKIYQWDMVEDYCEKCLELCVQEIEARKSGGTRIDPSIFYVKA